MSRSKKLPIIKDRPRNHKKSALYWRTIRSRWKTELNSAIDLEELQFSNPKSIVNDYDYSDYTFRLKDKKYERK